MSTHIDPKERSREDQLTGQSVERREDEPLLRGSARFTDDRSHPDMVHLTFVRSEHGHATIQSIDVEEALAIDGVLAVYTWDDLQAAGTPGRLPLVSGPLDGDIPAHPILAETRVRYQGQPIAAVVATDPYLARDGADAVDVTYTRLEAVVDPIAATKPNAPTLFDELPDNTIDRTELGDADATERAFRDADHTASLELKNNRLIPSALEPRVALATYETDSDRITVEMASQSVHGHRKKLAHTLGLPENKIRVIAPHVGGGFGHKGHHHPGEAMAAWAAKRLERPVKWTATRSENYLAGAHGRDHRTEADIAVDEDGRILGIRVHTYANGGGHGLGASLVMPSWYGSLLSSQYDIPAIYCDTRTVLTNTAPTHSYRGAGRPEAIYTTERLVDAAARELDMDPVELRRQNLIAPDDFPYETAVGATYDSGDYEPALQQAIDAIEYASLRESEREIEDGWFLGVGFACFTESTGSGYESGVVRVQPDGTVTVQAGTHSHGQGHATTYAQLVADALSVEYDRIEVEEGDTGMPTGTGTFGSRSTVVGGNAVVSSANDVLEKARALAAHQLDATPSDVSVRDGIFSAGDSSVSFDDIAELAYGRRVPGDLEPGLEATTFYEAEGTTYAFGTHAATVAVNPETGEVEIRRYVAVDDCGVRVNPRIVDGQVRGGVAQGIGQARSERTHYDEEGRLHTDSMLSYAVPRAGDLPDIETYATETPSPLNDLGVKGVGEAGTIAAPPAVVNAVVDALAPLGVDHIDMPLTDEAILQALRE